MDCDSSPLLGVALSVILLVVNFILAVAGASLQNCAEAELETQEDGPRRGAAFLLRLKDSPEQLIRAIWLYQSLTCVCIGVVLLAFVPSSPLWACGLALAVLLYLAGNSVPHMVGRKDPARWLFRLSGAVAALIRLASPFTYVLTAVTNGFVRLFGIDPALIGTEVTEDEIISMVNEGHEQGVLDAREAMMIQNIFELDDKEAEDIMTHRKNIIAICGTVNLRDAISFMVEQSVSRFPVYEETIDNVLGILHFRDAMKFHTMEQYDDCPVRDIPGLLRDCRYIPRTRGINLLFKNMQAEKIQMVLVVDEYGQTAGLVTMEDILEEIVGNIQDEYDNDVEFIHKGAGGSYEMDGMTPLQEAEEVLGIRFGEEFDTLNGFLISRLNRIPSEDEQPEICEHGYRFRVLKVKNKMVSRVQITKSEKEEKE